MTKFVALNCPFCAGPLRVAILSVRVDCDFCDAQTTLRNIDGVYELQLVNLLGATKEELRDEVRILRVQKAIRALDSRWVKAVDELMAVSNTRIRGPRGKDVSAGGAVGAGIGCSTILAMVPLVAGVFCFWNDMFVLSLACGALVFAVFAAGAVQTARYFRLLVKRDRMQAIYLARRQRLLNRIETVKRRVDHDRGN